MAKAAKVKIKLQRDYWFEDDVRTNAGAIVEVDESAAKIAIESGLATFEGVVNDPAA